MDSLNELKPFKRLDIEVVDIEHVTMRKFDPDHAVLLCHMTAVFSNGWRVPGMYETRLNIAGKGIYSWKPDR